MQIGAGARAFYLQPGVKNYEFIYVILKNMVTLRLEHGTPR